LIDREDRKSQLRTYKQSISWLQQGVPIMAFPEGMRSRDGRLMEFKKGLFALAIKTNVPIVPITLCNTHAIMPTYSFFPVQSGAGKVHVHIGQPIDPIGKSEMELERLVREEFLAHLPASQLPLLHVPTNMSMENETMDTGLHSTLTTSASSK
jgi:1-acyl-sn-glycerol-3-phosphate acyltransferase